MGETDLMWDGALSEVLHSIECGYGCRWVTLTDWAGSGVMQRSAVAAGCGQGTG